MITPEMSPYSTRPGNAEKHPGQVVLDADRMGRNPRRSSGQVKQERDAVEAKAKAVQEERLALMKRIAELEAIARDHEDQKVGRSVPAIPKREFYDMPQSVVWSVTHRFGPDSPLHRFSKAHQGFKCFKEHVRACGACSR